MGADVLGQISGRNSHRRCIVIVERAFGGIVSVTCASTCFSVALTHASHAMAGWFTLYVTLRCDSVSLCVR